MKAPRGIFVILSLLPLILGCTIGIADSEKYESDDVSRLRELERLRDTAPSEAARRYYQELIDDCYGLGLFSPCDSLIRLGGSDDTPRYEPYEYKIDERYLKKPETASTVSPPGKEEH